MTAEEHIAERASFDAFVAAADTYCQLIEATADTPRAFLIPQLAEALVDLYRAALRLPDTAPSGSEPADGSCDGSHVRQELETTLGEWDHYWQEADPFVRDEPVPASLADDLADIYVDLRRTAGWDRADAAWEWRFAFLTHWGSHLVDALRACHSLLAVAAQQHSAAD